MSLRSAWARMMRAFQHFRRAEHGNITMILGLSIIPLVVAAGVAIDYERAINARTQLLASLDTGALFAASYAMNNANTPNATLTSVSKPYVTQNYEDAGDATISNYQVVDNGQTVTASASLQLTTYFMSIMGKTSMSMSVQSTVQKSGINLEVSLVLDNTNSMNSVNAKTGNTAIADLKTAAAKFVTTVMPTTQGSFYTKIALVPYNNSVNMGSTAMAASARGAVASGTSTTGPGKTNETFNTSPTYYANYSSSCNNYTTNNTSTVCQRTLSATNCVSERPATVLAPTLPYLDLALSAYPVGWAYLPSGNPCSVTAVVPLSTSATTLNTAITSMVAANSTAGQVGITWGWYTLSPNVGIWSGSSVPAGYDKLTTTDATARVRKVMILMTDGEYNSAYCNGVITGYDTTNGSSGNPYYWSVSGSGGPADHIGCAPTNGGSYTQSNLMCSAIKAAGIEVYVITFQLDKTYPARVNLTNNCATDSAHVIDADSTSLDAAFSSIANKILAMRIAS